VSCKVGKACNADVDCAAGEGCDLTSKVCDADQCHDGIKNGGETDVDCGGSTCATCVVGRNCSTDADCTTKACDAMTMVCVTSQCVDRRQDGAETDVDWWRDVPGLRGREEMLA
jgi:hypothetical protein